MLVDERLPGVRRYLEERRRLEQNKTRELRVHDRHGNTQTNKHYTVSIVLNKTLKTL